MKTPKFILNRTEDYLYHSKLWIIGYASLFYLPVFDTLIL